MRALIQRVNQAEVLISQECVAGIGRGLLVFLGVGRGDREQDACWLADKVARLRVFPDEQGRMNRSVLDVGGSVLVISQFTLYGDARHGNRPGFDLAEEPGLAEPLYEVFYRQLRSHGLAVETGRFAASMQVRLENDGPVTFWLEYPDPVK